MTPNRFRQLKPSLTQLPVGSSSIFLPSLTYPPSEETVPHTPPEIERDVQEVGQTHLLNTFTDQLFSILLNQYLDQVSPTTIEIETQETKDAVNRIPNIPAVPFAKRVLNVHKEIQKYHFSEMASDEFVLNTAAVINRKAHQKATALLKEDPDFVQQCCGWSDHPKLLIPLKPSQLKLYRTATGKLLLSQAQEFSLLVCLALSNADPRLSQVDAQFLAQLQLEPNFNGIPITFLTITSEKKFIAIPKVTNPHRVYLGGSIDLQNQWMVLHGYEYGPQSQQIAIDQLKPINRSVKTILTEAQAYYASRPWQLEAREELDDLDDLYESEGIDPLEETNDLSDLEDLDDDEQSDDNLGQSKTPEN